jgi:two-component system, OmpR family, sensor histidine kinase KdpD
VVDTPDMERSSFDRGRDLQEAIDDAVDLGAEVVRLPAPDVVTGLEQVVRERGATHLVVGHQGSRGLRRITERPLADRILARLPDVEVHLVGARPGDKGPAEPP